MIKLCELSELIRELGEERSELKVIVPIFQPGKVGGRAGLSITALDVGFDHDHGKVFLRLEKEVTTLTAKQKAAILKSVNRGSSWHAYEQHKAMRARMAEETERKNALLLAARASVQNELDRVGCFGDSDEERQRLSALLESIDAELVPKRGARVRGN
jgi:hypothetical protein